MSSRAVDWTGGSELIEWTEMASKLQVHNCVGRQCATDACLMCGCPELLVMVVTYAMYTKNSLVTVMPKRLPNIVPLAVLPERRCCTCHVNLQSSATLMANIGTVRSAIVQLVWFECKNT